MPEDEEQTDDEQNEKDKPEEKEPAYSSSALEDAMEATTSNEPGAAPPTMHRECTFRVDHNVCSPNTFREDFKLTLRSLSSKQETRAVKGVSEPIEVGTALAKASLHALNGTPLKGKDEKDWLWDHLAPGGRQITIGMYSNIGMATEESVKKAESSLVSS